MRDPLTHDQWKGWGEVVAISMFASLVGYLFWERAQVNRARGR